MLALLVQYNAGAHTRTVAITITFLEHACLRGEENGR